MVSFGEKSFLCESRMDEIAVGVMYNICENVYSWCVLMFEKGKQDFLYLERGQKKGNEV